MRANDQRHSPVAAMRTELSTLSHTLDIPLAHGASVVVPNVTLEQKTVVFFQLCNVMHVTQLKAREKQAVKRVVAVCDPALIQYSPCSADWPHRRTGPHHATPVPAHNTRMPSFNRVSFETPRARWL